MGVVCETQTKPKATKWHPVAVLNWGAGGLLFYGNEEYIVGSHIKLRISFPSLKTPVNCVGKVLRVEEIKSPPMYLVALVFTKIGKKDHAHIKKLAEKYYLEHLEGGK